MRRPRLKAPKHLDVAYYHCVSRVVNRDYVLGTEEKEQFVQFMRLYERLYGLRVISYCIMSNHFHILVEVPRRPDELPDDAALVAHVRKHLGDLAANKLEWELAHFREMGAKQAAEDLRERWFSRMWDVSQYMKVLKQRFTQWFNGRHKRRGTLWEDRFRSVLVEGEDQALKTMAAYIELNPVRAKMCDDPKDYRWCSYAEAVAGDRTCQKAVRWLVSLSGHGGRHAGRSQPKTAKEALRRWRCFLFGLPESEGQLEKQRGRKKAGVNAEIFQKRIPHKKALEVLASGGRLSKADFLRCRVRYFSDGAAIGAKGFVEEVFKASRSQFSENRQSGARLVRGLDLAKPRDRLYNMRNLRKEVFG